VAEESKEPGLPGARIPDEYEAKYMAGEGVFYRDKIKVPGKFLLILALPLVIQLLTIVALSLTGQPIIGVLIGMPITAVVLAIVTLLFAVLRVTVTRKEVIVQYGLFGPRIPLESIRDARAVEYDWKTYGGWGIRRGLDGSWAYNMMGDAGRAVRLEWTDARGKKQVTLVASPSPDALARAIQEARVAARPNIRVAPAPDLAEFEAEAEAEAEAALLDEERKQKK
jgi:hypothetical protein